MSTPPPISADEMAGHVRGMVNIVLGSEVADPQRDGVFEMTSAATGQRFRVAVTEVPGWSEQMDRELAQLAGSEPTS